MTLTLRSAVREDLDWLDPFYESLMRPYVELTHEWDSAKFREVFDPSLISIIQVNGEDAGMLKVSQRIDCFYLGDIQIRPEYQGRGIGGYWVVKTIQDAQRAELPVRLRVLKGNPAKSFYERLGFAVEEELENCFQMIHRY